MQTRLESGEVILRPPYPVRVGEQEPVEVSVFVGQLKIMTWVIDPGAWLTGLAAFIPNGNTTTESRL